MAEVQSIDAWNLRLIESNQKFHKDLNEIRAMRNMSPIVPSYDWMKSKPEPVIPDLKPNQPWKESFQDFRESFEKMKEAADELRVTFRQMADDMKKLREESEASEQEAGSCEESVELLQEDDEQPIGELTHQVIPEIVFQESKISQETQKETHQESKCKNCSTNSKFSGGKNQFSTQEFRFIDGFCFSEDTSSDFVHNVTGEWIDKSIDHIEIEMTDYRANSVRPLQISNAYHVFDVMPVRGFMGNDSNTQLYNACLLKGNRIFDPGDFIEPRPAKKVSLELGEFSVKEVTLVKSNKTFSYHVCEALGWEIRGNTFVFDPEIIERSECDLDLRGDELRECTPVLDSLKGMSSFQQKGNCDDILVYPGIVNKEDGNMVAFVHFIARSESLITMKIKGFVFDPGRVLAWPATVLGVKRRLQWDPGGSCLLVLGILEANFHIRDY